MINRPLTGLLRQGEIGEVEAGRHHTADQHLLRASGPGFNCPCHDSSFDADGKRLDGPSPRDLDTLGTKVEDGFVMVDFQRFRQGIPDKATVG